ncbi:hypothetical protein DL765_001385 [Monosporascus sp. GIB2]|nr:hypothetical protein DL765_001385 [Monosporascus sp. GIB2]
MYALFNRTKVPVHALCTSCTLLRSGGDGALVSQRGSSTSRPKFADADHCSCNPEGYGSGPLCRYPERNARRDFWYASSDEGDVAEEVEYEDGSADDTKGCQGKKADRGGGIFKFGGILRRGNAGKDANSGDQSLQRSDPEEEAEAEVGHDAPAPLFLHPSAFPGVLSVDGEVPPTTGHGAIPSILVRRAQYTSPSPRPRGSGESSAPLLSPGLLSPPVLTPGEGERSPFVAPAAKNGERGLK